MTLSSFWMDYDSQDVNEGEVLGVQGEGEIPVSLIIAA